MSSRWICPAASPREAVSNSLHGMWAFRREECAPDTRWSICITIDRNTHFPYFRDNSERALSASNEAILFCDNYMAMHISSYPNVLQRHESLEAICVREEVVRQVERVHVA